MRDFLFKGSLAIMSTRLRLAVVLAVITPLGFGTKLYHGPLAGWVELYLGGVLYVIFFILLAAFIFTRAKIWVLGGVVFGSTCVLEFLQLSHNPLLERIRSTFLGRALIGSGFDLWDFPHYILGAILGMTLLNKVCRQKPILKHWGC